jgi:hypothetical protein
MGDSPDGEAMSDNGNRPEDPQRDAEEELKEADPAERKLSDLLGTDENQEETSQEVPNSPPQDSSTASRDQKT